ncbi:glycosyltransferase family 9 protein [Bdellovibrionota bacterium FG-2]
MRRLSKLVWKLAPSWEPGRLLGVIDFFPPGDGTSLLAAAKSDNSALCIAAKSRTIGDALMLSTLPRMLKARNPGLRINTYPRAFNPSVFFNNPYVDGLSYFPARVVGDDACFGGGHLMQLKEHFFDLPGTPDEEVRPEIYLLPEERVWGAAEIRRNLEPTSKPKCFFHPWGHTWKKVVSAERWSLIMKRWGDRVSFCQVGVEGHEKIPGAHATFFLPKSFWNARKLFALLSHADLFLGVNSGPMHIARAFKVPSLIFTEEGNIEEIFRRRAEAPYYLYSNWKPAFLYKGNFHLDVPALDEAGFVRKVDEVMELLLERA